jgi:sec-independent protein translocase protein TatC
MGRPNPQSPPKPVMPWMTHVIELRDRLMRSLIVVAVILVPLAFFSRELFTVLAGPLTAHLPEGTSMIATDVASPFLTPFKLALMTSIALAMPFILHQVWGFVAPGLYHREQSFAAPLLISSVALFYSGIAFAYFVVFPLVFGFLTSVAPEGVTVATDINSYLDFVLALFFAFGLAFEVPVATVLLVKTGFTTPAALATKRPYIFLGAFVAGMFLTPPDIISQTLLAVPMYLLFEVGIIMSKILVPGYKEVEAQRAELAAQEAAEEAAQEQENS